MAAADRDDDSRPLAMGRVVRTLLARLRADAGLRAISANVTWLVADRVLGLLLSVVITIMVVRYLGPADFGLLSYALAIVTILIPVVQLGLESVMVRELTTEPDSRDEILGSAAVVTWIAAVVLMPIAVILAGWFGNGDPRARAIVAILALQYLFHSLNVIDYWFRSRLQSRYTVWSSKAGLLVNAVVSFALIRSAAGVTSFAYATLLETAVMAGALVLCYRVSGASLAGWRFAAARMRALLASSAPFMIGSLASAVYARVDFVILRRLMTESDVGVYAAAVRYTELCYAIPTALIVSLFPSLIRARETMGDGQYRRRIQALYDLIAAGAYLIVIPTTLLAKPLMTMIFGAAYAPAGALLAVHIWTLLLVAIGMVRSSWLVAEGLGRYYMLAAIGGAVINVAVDLALIPRYGAVAAAWASIAAQLFVILGSSLLSRKLWPSIRQIALALVVPLRPKSLRIALGDALHGKL